MRICMIGKYPPIEGGVSTHQFWSAHALASLGHHIHVVTNANEVEPRFRMLMRSEDWEMCERRYANGGYVRVHWSDRFSRRQDHIPRSNPFTTKLASLAAQVSMEHDLELLFSYYLEPYGVSGYLAAQMTGLPHVVKHAGSDAGRLRPQAQFGVLYDHILRAATRVVTGPKVAKQLQQVGLSANQLFLHDDFRVPPIFEPNVAALDLERLLEEIREDRVLASMLNGPSLVPSPYVGIYGKIGDVKGTFDLLRAMRHLQDDGLEFGLLILGHGWGDRDAMLQDVINELELHKSVMQLPFLPHWRVPSFIRLCRVTCFLERDFPIPFHAPMVPREILACGGCLIAPAESLSRQPLAERLVHGYNCVAVRDVHNTNELAERLRLVIEDAEGARQVGLRGHEYSVLAESTYEFPRNLVSLFAEAIEERRGTARSAPTDESFGGPYDDLRWTRWAMDRLGPTTIEAPPNLSAEDDASRTWALSVYANLLELFERGKLNDDLILETVRLELLLTGLLRQGPPRITDSGDACEDGLFRLAIEDRTLRDEDIDGLCPLMSSDVTLQYFSYDAQELLAARLQGPPPSSPARRTSCLATIPRRLGNGVRVISLSPEVGAFLERCQGQETVAELLASSLEGVDWPDVSNSIMELFRSGLLCLTARASQHLRIS